MIRESLFVCSCRLKTTVRVAYVRAWDEAEAAEIFVREMNEEGILDASDVRVRSVASARLRGPGREPSGPGAGEGITPAP